MGKMTTPPFYKGIGGKYFSYPLTGNKRAGAPCRAHKDKAPLLKIGNGAQGRSATRPLIITAKYHITRCHTHLIHPDRIDIRLFNGCLGPQ